MFKHCINLPWGKKSRMLKPLPWIFILKSGSWFWGYFKIVLFWLLKENKTFYSYLTKHPLSKQGNTFVPLGHLTSWMCACCARSVLEGQETITQEAFSEHLLNYGSGQLHGNNFCFIEPQDITWAIKYSFVFCELISNRIPPYPNFLSSVTVQRSRKTLDSFRIQRINNVF